MEKQNEVPCVHYFYIDYNNKGICLKCGEERQYMSPADLMDYLDRKPLYGKNVEHFLPKSFGL